MSNNKKQYHIFIDKTLMETIKARAKLNSRPVSSEITLVLESGIPGLYGYDALQELRTKQAEENS